MSQYTLTAKLIADEKGLIKGFGKAQEALAKMQSKTASFSSGLKNIGKDISRVGDNLTRRITTPAVAAATALTGITLVKGFNRLTGIDTAQAKLKGLGHNAENVEIIMQSALDSVRGTAYGLDEAATTAANAVAAGIKPGKELTRYLTLTGDAAAIAGSSMGEMGSIINKVQTAQKAYTGELNQLADRGIPIFEWLGEQAGVSAEKVREMASEGKISSEMFLRAIEDNIGGAAKIMGEESFTAGIANIGAAIGRVGAQFLDAGGKGGGFFSTIKQWIPTTIEFIDSLADKATELGVKFGESVNNAISFLADMKGRFDALSPSIQSLITKGSAIGALLIVGLGPALRIIGGLTTGFGVLTGVVSFLLSPIGLVVGAIVGLGAVFGVAMAKSEEFRNKVLGVFSVISNTVTNIINTLKPILLNMWDGAKNGVATFANELGGKLLSAFEVISSVVTTVVDVIGQFVSSIMDGFKSAGGEVNTLSTLFLGFNPVLKIAMTIFSQFGPQIAAGFSQVASMVVPILTLLGQTLGELAAAIIPMVLNVVSTLIPIIINLGTTIMSIVSSVLPILLDIFTQLVPVVMSLVQTVMGLISQLLPLVAIVIDALLPVFMVLIDTILNIVTAVAPALIAIIGAVIAIFQAVIPIVMSVLTAVINVIAGIISAITPIIAFIAMIISTIISIIAPIVTFIAGVIANIFNAIRPIITFVTGVFNTVFNVISGVFRNASNFITSAISKISGTIAKLSGRVSAVFNTIRSIVTKIMDSVSNKIQGVFTAITNSWNGLRGFVSNVFDGIGSNMEKLVNRVKGFVNVVIGSINSAIGIINKIPGVNISKIPQLQRGTDDWMGGFAYMNEGGRGELVHLPDGTQVIPHDVSMRYAREAGKSSSASQTYFEERTSNVNLSRIESLLEGIYKKDPSLYVDGERLVDATYDQYDRKGANVTNLTGRWGR